MLEEKEGDGGRFSLDLLAESKGEGVKGVGKSVQSQRNSAYPTEVGRPFFDFSQSCHTGKKFQLK